MSRYHRHTHKKAHKTLVVKKRKQYRFIDRATYAAAIIEPLITVPQAYQIFRDRTAAGISIFSWVGYQALTLVWLWYGIVHRERVIIVYQLMFLVLQTAIITGAIMYGGRWW